MKQLEAIIGDHSAFLEDILGRVEGEGFDFGDFSQIDHMCYRTVSEENYTQKKEELLGVAKLCGETAVNGRPISTFRLNEPVRYGNWRIDGIELPAPKEGSVHQEGLEHIEFVLYDSLQNFLEKYKGKSFETRAIDRGVNPEIGLQLGNLSAKFHIVSLLAVVEYLEPALGIDNVKDNN